MGKTEDSAIRPFRIRQTRPVADRTLEIEFLDPGVRAYVFTFG